jgi:MoaA/NifB/PqqE/SkfB family radical SAM enzyme
MKINLNEYSCAVPFTSLEIHNNTYFVCCPSWLPNKISSTDYPIEKVWNSEPLLYIRNSVLDGSFKYCDKKMCPWLSKLIETGELGTNSPIFKKQNTPSQFYDNIKNNNCHLKENAPENIIMNFDRTCNYKCPSCRVDLIVENSDGIKRVQKTIDEIDTHFSHNIKTIYITGSGDPFVSVGFRNYLRNFNPKKYPKLYRIHLHTNASMWTKEMWDLMPNIHKYVKSCEISIDAGTKDTYENKTRLGGNWDTLIANLKFISTIPNLRKKMSFVVQDSNYIEMTLFAEKMNEIFNNKCIIYFGKITNWGTFSDGEFLLKKVWDENHPEYNLFVEELNKVNKIKNIYHNMNEFINYKKQNSLL